MINEVQKVLFDVIVAAVAPDNVFDHIPQDESDYPFVRIEPLAYTEADTDDEIAFTATLSVHTWSNYRGSKEAADIQLKIFNALHRRSDLTSANYSLSNVVQEFSNILTDKDGIVRHGIQRFVVQFEEN